MGTWDAGHFDNDGAGDLGADMGSAFSPDVALVALRACHGLADDYLEAPEGQRGIAAAALVCRFLAGDGAVRVENRSIAFGGVPADPRLRDDLRRASVQALTRVLDQNSEIRELWEESPRFMAWSDGIERLRTELSKDG